MDGGKDKNRAGKNGYRFKSLADESESFSFKVRCFFHILLL